MNLTTQDAQVACFQNVADQLEPGGCFVIEVLVPGLQRLPPGETFQPFDVSPTHSGSTSTTSPRRGSCRTTTGSTATVEVFSPPFRYVWPSELDLMARLARMRLRERWSDWTREPFTSASNKARLRLDEDLTGVLLVGGASERFGSPKALARFAGETLAERGWRILGEAFDDRRLAVGKGDPELPFPVVVEPAEPRAPLVGVITGLRAAAAEVAVFLPVDCPLVTPSLLRDLGKWRASPDRRLSRRLLEGRPAGARAQAHRRRPVAPGRQPTGARGRRAAARQREHAPGVVSARTRPRRSRPRSGLTRSRRRAGRRA